MSSTRSHSPRSMTLSTICEASSAMRPPYACAVGLERVADEPPVAMVLRRVLVQHHLPDGAEPLGRISLRWMPPAAFENVRWSRPIARTSACFVIAQKWPSGR